MEPPTLSTNEVGVTILVSDGVLDALDRHAFGQQLGTWWKESGRVPSDATAEYMAKRIVGQALINAGKEPEVLPTSADGLWDDLVCVVLLSTLQATGCPTHFLGMAGLGKNGRFCRFSDPRSPTRAFGLVCGQDVAAVFLDPKRNVAAAVVCDGHGAATTADLVKVVRCILGFTVGCSDSKGWEAGMHRAFTAADGLLSAGGSTCVAVRLSHHISTAHVGDSGLMHAVLPAAIDSSPATVMNSCPTPSPESIINNQELEALTRPRSNSTCGKRKLMDSPPQSPCEIVAQPKSLVEPHSAEEVDEVARAWRRVAAAGGSPHRVIYPFKVNGMVLDVFVSDPTNGAVIHAENAVAVNASGKERGLGGGSQSLWGRHEGSGPASHTNWGAVVVVPTDHDRAATIQMLRCLGDHPLKAVSPGMIVSTPDTAVFSLAGEPRASRESACRADICARGEVADEPAPSQPMDMPSPRPVDKRRCGIDGASEAAGLAIHV
mmetsp:Transcript_42574/g.92550  ORF Transcript_42574/g.92550 Transcript_42574/m.92550 type:complete len:491 (+) Transcript_42574:46-1518(+)